MRLADAASRIKRLLAEPGRWMCNLGHHKEWGRDGSQHVWEGRASVFEISPRHTTTLHYFRCQRCGREVPGGNPSLRRPW